MEIQCLLQPQLASKLGHPAVPIETSPGQVQAITWDDIAMVDELELLEMQDAEGLTVAEGFRDTTLAEPAA